MSKWAIGLFLLLFGILGLISTKVPEWVLPAIALLAGGAVLLEGRNSK